MEQSPPWEVNSHSASQISCLVWNPEGLLPCSQENATGPYHEFSPPTNSMEKSPPW